MTLRKTDGQIARARKEWKLMSNVDFNTIEALIAQEPIGNLMRIKDIVDKEIQFCRNNMTKQAVPQVRAVPRMEGQLRRSDRTDEFDNLKTQAGVGAVDPDIQTVIGTGISDVGQESLRANYQDKLHVSESGATSSHVPLRYDLIPRSLLDCVAQRYTIGSKVHGERGYQKGLADRGFIINRINHIAEHWNMLFHPKKQDEDTPYGHLGAVLWGIGFLCEVLDNDKGQDILWQLIEEGRVRVL
ncbi:MAG TPA: dATP/dGTP diphosphohydrolase domain-containing protein [Candidatus Saccharimonadales bacterium]|jgi:hypothetical protein